MWTKLKQLIRIWYHDWTPEAELRERIAALALDGAAERAGLLCYLIAAAFAFYGFTSINFIHRFDTSVTLWHNLWPRLLFNVVPLVLLGHFLSKPGPRWLRIAGWMLGYPLVVHAASWINVWPIALAGEPDILLYVHGPNAWIIAIMFMTIAPPNKYILLFSLSFFVIFVLPLALVTYLSNSSSSTFFAQTCVIDLAHSLLLNTVAGSIISRLRVNLIKIEINQKKEASKFLGKTVSKAIFENRGDLLVARTVQAFGMMMDIRASTELGQLHEQQMKRFIHTFDALVPRIIGKYGGTTHKSLGDGYLATFGALDDGDTAALAGLGFDAELAAAVNHRSAVLLANLCKAYAELITEVQSASTAIFGESMIALGAGIDFGAIEIKIKGDDEHRKEFDLAGPIIARCSRLEEYSKLFRPNYAPMASILLLSPEASAHLVDHQGFDTVTVERPVRNFPEIKWVNVRGYAYERPVKFKMAS